MKHTGRTVLPSELSLLDISSESEHKLTNDATEVIPYYVRRTFINFGLPTWARGERAGARASLSAARQSVSCVGVCPVEDGKKRRRPLVFFEVCVVEKKSKATPGCQCSTCLRFGRTGCARGSVAMQSLFCVTYSPRSSPRGRRWSSVAVRGRSPCRLLRATANRIAICSFFA